MDCREEKQIMSADTPQEPDMIVSFRLNPEKDKDIIKALDIGNKSAEIKRIIRAYINFIQED